MAKNIQSLFILKKVLLFLDEARKLDLIKYNKSLQNKLNITLLNYKLFSGKYFKDEIYGIGKLYDLYYDKVIYEGEYLKGKKMEKELNMRLKAI